MNKTAMLAVAILLLAATAAFAAAPTPMLRCESQNGKYRECSTAGLGRVTLGRQLSDVKCIEGQSWGNRNGVVWVDNGCRADFVATNGPNVSTQRSPRSVRNVVCESSDRSRHRCDADTRFGVTIAKQISKSSCDFGEDWGYDRDGIWVQNGCRAEFQLGRSRRANRVAETVRCESDGKYRTCPADTYFGVELARQISNSACVKDRTWGFNEQGIWVNGGCRADFTIGVDYGYQSMTSSSRGTTILCESTPSGQRHYCAADTSFGVRMSKQVSDTRCVKGTNWGFDENGVWVSDGCRAQFVLDSDR
ncbi:MAG TPA: DUF3011 domain-containing protein [Thermoanaerobaculia bacterium]|jgi:hypothetical protein